MTPEEENEMKMMMEEDKERWVSIEGCEGYEISTYGRVRSYWQRKTVRNGGNRGGFQNEIVLSETPIRFMKEHLQIRSGRPYYRINKMNKLTNRLLAIAFIPNPSNKPEVDHIDRDITNNKLSNLRWATRQENGINKVARNESGIKGVRRKHSKCESWESYWVENGKCLFKSFKTKEEAVEHRKKMVDEHYNQEFYHEG
jgi:hypothetical protein